MDLIRIGIILLMIMPFNGIAQKQSNTIDTQAKSERDSLDAKITRYTIKKDIPNIIKYTVEKIDRFGLDTVRLERVFTNNMIYELIFMHSDDLTVLNKSLKWMKSMIDTEVPAPSHMDTYANLLYKVGRKKEAIIWQTKASTLEPKDQGLKETLEKMKNNIPTWNVNN